MQALVFSTQLTHPLEEENVLLSSEVVCGVPDAAENEIDEDHDVSQVMDLTHFSEFSTLLTHSIEEDEEPETKQEEELTNSFNKLTKVTRKTSSYENAHSTEILVYCQNFNRMRSAKKINVINNNILCCPFSIILATETSWDESVRNEEVFGNRFNVFRNDRNFSWTDKKSGGGVLIAVSTDINSEIINTTKFKEFEHVWAKAHISGELHVFASVYFPPESANKNNYEKFLEIADEIMSSLAADVKVHLYGDFNQRNFDFIPDPDIESILLPIVGDNETLQYLSDKFGSLCLNQVNHVRNEQNCFLDLLLTNINEDFCVTESITPLWNNEKYHSAIEYSLFFHQYTRPYDYEFEEVFEYHSANYTNIRNRLNMINWQLILRNETEIENAVEIFYKLLSEVIIEEVPKRKKRRSYNNKYPVWYNRKIRNLQNRKQKAHKIYKLENTNHSLTNYLHICNELKMAISIAFDEYNSKTELEIKSCPKAFFSYVKSKLKSDNFPLLLHLDETESSNNETISNLFSTFFQEIYTNFSETDRDRDYFSYFPDFTRDINVRHIEVQDITEGLQNIDASKGCGPDGIPPVFIKNLAVELTTPLFHLFNQSLESGIFPTMWKQSFLVPIFKTGKKSDIRNYRGIAIISCIPKLFEKLINDKLFVQIKNRITCMQHGFFKGRSTTTNILEFIDYSLKVIDNGNYVQALYTDFSKAFDRIDIPLLLLKLHKMGIQHGLLKWIESYLKNRQQIVRFKGKLSDPVNVTSGVPQGSHLGPLLFILYVNDVSYILENLKILIYADDMKLYMEIKDSDDIHTFQNEILIFYNWCNKSLLQLNVKKCNSIAFSRKRNTPHIVITLGNHQITKCERVRDLGILLDSKLTFIDHYNAIINRANNMLGFIKRFCYNFRDPYTIKTLYVAYVRSILEYGSIIWAPFPSVHEARIESVQKQFLLYALRKLGWTIFPLPSYEARCMLINIQTLKERRECAMISFINNLIAHHIDSATLLSKLNFYTPSRILRNRTLFVTHHYRTNYAKYGPMNQMMQAYNKHSEFLDFNMTKSKLKKLFITRRNIATENQN